MPKKAKRNTSKKGSTHKNVGYYLRIYFISVFVCLIFFVGVSFFPKDEFICANSLTCKSDLVEEIDNNAFGEFLGQKIVPPKINLAFDNFNYNVLGDSTAISDKHIYVNLKTQTLHAFQGDEEVMKAIISSGKWGRTPSGNFKIRTKLRATRMSGGSGSDYYNLPNVPYVMYFYGDYGLHGAYWHNNFGHPMSHGCINMRIVDARKLFNWADGPTASTSGTPVSVCNEFTGPNKCVQENPVKI